jgi:xanthine dehydrogenase large subunit
MSRAFEFTLNGRPVRIEDYSPNTTLLEYLRGTGWTGSKEGCAEGDCGACSVAIVDRDAQGKTCYRAINSCLVPLALMAGREVVTVEGIAQDGALHPVQQKMVECHGSQCGYCTPGFIMASAGLLRRNPLPTDDEIREALGSNICRCTGYVKIIEAVKHAAALCAEGLTP